MTLRESEAILAFKPPPLAMLRLWLAPARAWHRPSFIGVEQVDPSHPTMFVGNHTLYGIQDVPHILYELRRVHGIFPRTLSDRVHFEVPVWRDLLTVFGCVALAAAFGYPIVPFASLGADESLHVAVDGPDIMSSPIGKLLRASGIADKYLRGGEALPPLVRGLGLTWIPEPDRFFVSFGPPISTSPYRRRAKDVAAMHELRAKVASSIEAQLEFLQRMRGGMSGESADARRVRTSDWDNLVAGLENQTERAKRRVRSRTKATRKA